MDAFPIEQQRQQSGYKTFYISFETNLLLENG